MYLSPPPASRLAASVTAQSSHARLRPNRGLRENRTDQLAEPERWPSCSAWASQAGGTGRGWMTRAAAFRIGRGVRGVSDTCHQWEDHQGLRNYPANGYIWQRYSVKSTHSIVQMSTGADPTVNKARRDGIIRMHDLNKIIYSQPE